MKSNKTLYLIPVMFCFFAMGFVDLVGIASNYVKEDLSLNDSVANIFPSLVFFWFLIFSVPTGMLMNKIGRKKTVLLSLIVTVVSLFLPLLGETFPIMLIALLFPSWALVTHSCRLPSIRSCRASLEVPTSLLLSPSDSSSRQLLHSLLLILPCGVPQR